MFFCFSSFSLFVLHVFSFVFSLFLPLPLFYSLFLSFALFVSPFISLFLFVFSFCSMVFYLFLGFCFLSLSLSLFFHRWSWQMPRASRKCVRASPCCWAAIPPASCWLPGRDGGGEAHLRLETRAGWPLSLVGVEGAKPHLLNFG